MLIRFNSPPSPPWPITRPRWAPHGQGPLKSSCSERSQHRSRRGEGSPALKRWSSARPWRRSERHQRAHLEGSHLDLDIDTADSRGGHLWSLHIFTNFEPKAPCSSYFWYPHVVGYMSYFINDHQVNHQVCLIPKLRLVSCPSWWVHIQSEPSMNMFIFYSFSCFPKH